MTDWRDDAACVDNPRVDTADFFPEEKFDGESTEKRAHIKSLHALCADCLVKQECRDWADKNKISYGFVAGETSAERQRRWGRETRRTPYKPRHLRVTVPRPTGGAALP